MNSLSPPASRPETSLLQRAFRFAITGGLTTAVAYTSWMLLLKVTNYAVATALAWLAAVVLGFLLNRRFTFGVTGSARRGTQFGFFVAGAVGQLLIGEACAYVTLGRLGMAPTWTFLITLALNTSFGFLFHNFITFRRRESGAL